LPVNRARRFTKQLNDYRTGSRTNQLMTDIAKALDEATLADVAAYYAAQPKRNPNPATLADSPPEIVRLVELGDPSRNIPPCAACHRPGSGGPIETPILSEQWKEYVALQLEDVCLGRSPQRRLWTHERNRLKTYAGRNQRAGDVLSRWFQVGPNLRRPRRE
jgi:cytochrome c553